MMQVTDSGTRARRWTREGVVGDLYYGGECLEEGMEARTLQGLRRAASIRVSDALSETAVSAGTGKDIRGGGRVELVVRECGRLGGSGSGAGFARLSLCGGRWRSLARVRR